MVMTYLHWASGNLDTDACVPLLPLQHHEQGRRFISTTELT